MQLSRLACIVGLGFLIIFIMIFYRRPSKLFASSILSDINAFNFRFAKQIDYEISMEKIKQYRISTYPNNTRYRWLFLTNFRTYSILMDRHYFAQYYAALRHPNIEPVLWGRDFPGYETSKTIIENIRKRFGSYDYFDVIYQSGGIYYSRDVRLASRYSPIMMREHECWGYRCLPWVIDENVTILLGFRNFANKTFVNYWRKCRASIGESLVELRQLARVQWIYWRMSTELSPIGDFPMDILANVHRVYFPKSNRLLFIEIEHSYFT